MIRRRTQVLTQRENVDGGAADVPHRLDHLLSGLAESKHQARLGQHLWAMRLGKTQHLECLLVTRTGVAHRVCQPAHGLDVLCKDTEPAVNDRRDSGGIAAEIRCQRLHRNVRGARFDGPDALGIVGCSAVVEVITIHGREYDVLQAHEFNRARDVGGLLAVEPAAGVSRVNRTEPTGAGADLTHEHDRRRAVVPALADVRALGLFAHRCQAMRADGLAHLLEARSRRYGSAQPGRLRRRRRRN